jgi:hypothetical protein
MTVEPIAGGVVNTIDRRGGLDVLGRYRGTDEDIPIIIILPVEEAAKDRVVEGLGELRLLVFIKQVCIVNLDPLPKQLVQLGDVEAMSQVRDASLTLWS